MPRPANVKHAPSFPSKMALNGTRPSGIDWTVILARRFVNREQAIRDPWVALNFRSNEFGAAGSTPGSRANEGGASNGGDKMDLSPFVGPSFVSFCCKG